MSSTVNDSNIADEKQEIHFHLIKTGNYRVYHVDGVFGGISPNGALFMSIFTERAPIPQELTQVVNKNTGSIEELREKRVGKDGLIRDIEAGLVMNIEVARSLNDWLTGKLREYDEKVKQPNINADE